MTIDPDPVLPNQFAERARTDAALADEAVDLARRLLTASIEQTTRSERRRQHRMGRLLGDHDGRELIFGLTDQVLRIDDPTIAAKRFGAIVRDHPTNALGLADRAMLRAGAAAGALSAGPVMSLVTKRIKAETAGIVIDAEDPAFANHLAQRRADGFRLNVNPLGEAILSEAEADERMSKVLERIDRTDVDYVSVKISAIVANLSTLAFDDSVAWISERLCTLYRAANAAEPPTFVNLDMEEYRDLELTVSAFIQVLSRPEFTRTDAGIVLQAYLPESHDALDLIGAWAAQRRAAGGGRIKVRLVKGANLAMEQVESALHGWTQAPYPSKADVDASYKRILDSALCADWRDSLRIGVASHNLFDIAWAMLRVRDADAHDRVDFEMLEGMAPAQARVVLDEVGELLMYAPIVADRDYAASIAYLSRRLDENTQADNFLRVLFTLAPDSDEFAQQERRFRRSVADRHTIGTRRLRHRVDVPTTGFVNQPDADVTEADTRHAIVGAIKGPPRPSWTTTATSAQIDEIVAVAANSTTSTATRAERRVWLERAADLMESERHQTVGLMANEVAKTPSEGDPEVSEAIDFCRYYGRVGTTALDDAATRGVKVEARGVIVVVGPWNFPYAIPVGGVAAALAAGNSVILKPAPEAVAVGAWIADQFWRAGVPKDVVQLVVCADEIAGELVTSHSVDTVVLTGAYATAQLLYSLQPQMRLFAETSGKNALVITASADIDQAIGDLVRSAFGHAGQKCSAASLAIIEASLYDSDEFMRRLADAVLSVRVGPADDPASMMGPVIDAPTGNLQRALTTLEPSQTWLVQPTALDDSGRLWSPGVIAGVQAGAWFHTTECFGPVLGLMRADDLDHAVQLQNATAYGLTGGIHSLDEAEVERWLDAVEVGNAYVNRHITGAIVQRQPFGGWKRSSVGGGAKAGGPNYIYQFAQLTTSGASEASAVASMSDAWALHFAGEHDPSALAAESNVLRYRPLDTVVVRHDGTCDDELAWAAAAARVAGVTLEISDCRVTDDATFAAQRAPGDRVRLRAPIDPDVLASLHANDVVVIGDPIVADGGVELRHWVAEQAVSTTAHRHGRLQAQPGETNLQQRQFEVGHGTEAE